MNPKLSKFTKSTAWALLLSYLSVSTFSGVATACTLFGASGKATKDGNVYLASTSDNPYLPGPRKPVYLSIPKNGYKFVHTPCIIEESPGKFVDVGSDRGMNEKGFAWTRSWVVPNEPEAVNKTPAVEWFLKMGATVATVEEAIKYVQNNPKGVGTQGNYIFADAAGNMAVVEVGYRKVNVKKWTKGETGMAVRANRWRTDEMKPLDISEKENPVYYTTSAIRERRATELLESSSGKVDVETMKRFLSDNVNREATATGAHGRSISSHGMTDGTVSAEVYDPAHRTFWYTYGWPDGDVKNIKASHVGANTNTWGTWLPFVLDQMTEEGFYTDRDGMITPIGARYLAQMKLRA